MREYEIIICSKCNNEIKYVKGKRHKLSALGVPQTVSCPEGCAIVWDNVLKCPECGEKILV